MEAMDRETVMTHYVRRNPNYPAQPQKWLVIHRPTEEYVDYADTRKEAREKAHELSE
jgi:hypothetical protein